MTLTKNQTKKVTILSSPNYSYLLTKFNITFDYLIERIVLEDSLSKRELRDLEYIEDRLETHLENDLEDLEE